MDKLYRTLITVMLISLVVWHYEPYNTLYFYDLKTLVLLDSRGLGVSPFLSALSIPVFILYCLSSVGLYFYLNSARIVFTFLMVFNIALAPWSGVFVSTGLDILFEQLNNTITGLIVGLSYFSSIATKFSSK